MSTISASTTSTTGFKVTSDTTGTLVFQTGASPTTAMSISSSQIISFTNPPTATGGGSVATNTAYGTSALAANTTGAENTAVGSVAMASNTTGGLNFAGGRAALASNTTGSNNTAAGWGSLYSNTTASNNTAVGYQAGYNNTAADNTFVGWKAGYSNTSGTPNTYIGVQAGYNTTGSANTFVGQSAGYYVTTGAKNTILGAYTGNQGGLDIRTASNYIVLSDGDGNPQIYNNGTFTYFGIGGTASSYTGTLKLLGADANNRSCYVALLSNGTEVGYVGIQRGIQGGTAGTANNMMIANNPNYGVYLNGSTATSWTSASDERLKENLVEITDASSKVASLRAVVGNYKSDENKTRKPFLIAQDVQKVLPEAVSQSAQVRDDPTEYLGVSYTEVIPLLVAAIKELKAEFDAYKEAHQ